MTSDRRQVELTFLITSVEDGLATLTINRPRASNALNWALLEQLRCAVQQAAQSADVRGIVIAAAGKIFVSGADVGFFVRCLEAGNVQRIVDCIRASQEVFDAIEQCPKPVVASVDGAALGGGVELALACHRIAATPRASFAFPETRLGIFPASGGTYRTPRRIGVELTKWLIYTGYLLSPAKALAIGLIDQVVPPEQLPQAARSATRLESGTADAAAHTEWQQLKSLFAEYPLQRLLRGDVPAPEGHLAVQALQSITKRSPLALQWVERLLDSGTRSNTSQAALSALEGVPAVFTVPQVKAALRKIEKKGEAPLF